jgi:hypothetical protein
MSAAEAGGENKVSETNTSMDLGVPGVGTDGRIATSEVAQVASQQPEKSKICGVCNDHESKYKCTRCALP